MWGAGTAQWNSSGLRAGWSGIRVRAGAGNVSLHHCVQTGSVAHPASYPMGTRGSSLGIKRPGREADHWLPSSAEVKNAWGCISTPQYAFMAWCSVKTEGQLYLYTHTCASFLLLYYIDHLFKFKVLTPIMHTMCPKCVFCIINQRYNLSLIPCRTILHFR
jgi:hypothetical protein